MRDITITGTPSPAKDIVLRVPDEYTFVFAPNIATVTLGSGYAANEEVTVSANGITLKRNCINRVCKFDLSVLFRSYFENANFEIEYGIDVLDPFLVDNVEITFAADSESDVVDFYLRWGALQFDEPDDPTVINFPFWAEMPLALNGSILHTFWKSVALDISGDYSQLAIVAAAAADFDYQLTNAEDPAVTLQTTNYKLTTCPTDGHYLRWVDARGRLWHFMFYASRERATATEIKTTEILKRYPESYEDGDYTGRELVVSKTKRRSFTCYATVDSDIFAIVQSVAASPLVAWYTGERWVNVRVTDMTVTPRKRFTQDIEFTVLMPEDYVQIR